MQLWIAFRFFANYVIITANLDKNNAAVSVLNINESIFYGLEKGMNVELIVSKETILREVYHTAAQVDVLLMTHKIVHKHCPPYLHDLIKFVSGASSRSMRVHKFKLRIPFDGVEFIYCESMPFVE